VVVLALILATLATVGVFLYSQGVKEDAKSGGDLVTVVVSDVDIPANSDLNQYIADGSFRALQVPVDAVVADAITQLSQLEGRRNSVVLFAGEQIPLGRVQGGEVPGGLLSIPEGHQAVTVALDAPRAISGVLAGGDNVAIYATFTGVEVVRLNKKLQAPADGTQERPQPFDTTIVLAPQVEVLRVIREVADVIAGEQQDASASSSIQVILALEPLEAQRFVYAMEQGLVYLSLLPPGEEGVQLDPLTAARVLLPQVAGTQNEG
jgi:Flp pilus assembly protein CpaB